MNDKKYLVITEDINGFNYYIGNNLKWYDGLCDPCIWNETPEQINAILKEDSKKFKYTYKIIEF